MRETSTTARRRLAVGWFWPLLLALPGCSFSAVAAGPFPNLWPGPIPRSSAVFCDIERPLERHCASDDEIATGIRMASAALALNSGATSAFAIDDSPAALQRCGGKPEAVHMQGAFPEGYVVCVNCGQTQIDSAPATDNNAICAAQCTDFFGQTAADGTVFPDNPADPAVASFCANVSHVSTNFPVSGCFDNACLGGGAIDPAFVDPRRAAEPVEWGDLVGVTANGNSLTRTSATSTNFDAGAASTQLITHGDAYVEFSDTVTSTTSVAGLSSGAPPDTDPTQNGIGFAISLSKDGQVHIEQSGVQVGTFGAFAAGDRFRVDVRDRFDGTATISYSRIVGTCTAGSPCNEQVLFTSATPAAYPLRVDSSFREQGADLTDVRLVRIH